MRAPKLVQGDSVMEPEMLRVREAVVVPQFAIARCSFTARPARAFSMADVIFGGKLERLNARPALQRADARNTAIVAERSKKFG